MVSGVLTKQTARTNLPPPAAEPGADPELCLPEIFTKNHNPHTRCCLGVVPATHTVLGSDAFLPRASHRSGEK